MGRLKDSLSAYLSYRFAVRSKFSLHSPFIYCFWSGVLNDKTPYTAFRRLEDLRKEWMRDDRSINRLDLGAGPAGSVPQTGPVKVKDLARKSLVSAAEGRLLFRLVKEYKPMAILELGTSLGLSSLYMAEAAPLARIITLEGCPETAALARLNFETAGKKNISLLQGPFDVKLPEALTLMPEPDLVFIDGNHRKEATLAYWEECMGHIHAGSIMVLDDIHWSAGMEEAWKLIISRPEVKVSIDLFSLGLLFFREELSKEDFVLRF